MTLDFHHLGYVSLFLFLALFEGTFHPIDLIIGFIAGLVKERG